ncbi:MFS transporter [Nocardioides pantholopis]|uniref:MFS transporter n=1 Tax=Nocardioides pantholopis TaxID=2483798 RepID=UPI000F09075E|nr:MFS transporter [Nocardioides pantholopis]
MTSTRARLPALIVLATVQLMVILDGTIVNVALPAVRADLGLSEVGLAWVVNAFFVAFALVLLPAGRLGDLVGPRRVLTAGLTVFVVATALCGLAESPAALLAARALQGVGGGLASAVVLGMVAALFPEPAGRARAFGALAFVGAAGGAAGALLGGALTDLGSWRWVFGVNVPLALAVLAGVLLAVPEQPGIGLRAGLAARVPLVPRRLLTHRRFALANAVLLSVTVAGFSFQFLSGLYLQEQLGWSPMRTGLAYLPVTAAIAVASIGLSARLAASIGPERVAVAGLVLFVVGLVVLSAFPADGAFWRDVAFPMLLLGTGFGLAMPQVIGMAMAVAGEADGGAASGVVATTQQLGGAVGLAVLVPLASATTLGTGLLAAAGVLAVGAGVAATLVGPPADDQGAPGREVGDALVR